MFLAIVMVLGNVPVSALATENEETTAPACEHSYETVTTDATCTEDGSVVYTCACGDTYTETISAAGHTWGDWTVTAEATYEAAGSQTRVCACGAEDTEAIPQLVAEPEPSEEPEESQEPEHEHVWGDWTVVTEATYEAAGSKTRACDCGETETEEIPQLVKEKEELSGETRKIYFLNTEAWEDVYVSWSFDEEDFEDIEFPGEEMDEDKDLEEVYVIELPVEADKVTFNDGVEVTEELLAEEAEAGLEIIHAFEAELYEEGEAFAATVQVEQEDWEEEVTEWVLYADLEAAAEVQALIDALPTSFASQEEVDLFWDETAVELDAAIDALTDEQQLLLDQTNYDAAIDAAAAFTNPEFDEDTTWADVQNVKGSGTQADPYIIPVDSDSMGHLALYTYLEDVIGLNNFSSGYMVDGNGWGDPLITALSNDESTVALGKHTIYSKPKSGLFQSFSKTTYIEIVKIATPVVIEDTDIEIDYNFYHSASSPEQDVKTKIAEKALKLNGIEPSEIDIKAYVEVWVVVGTHKGYESLWSDTYGTQATTAFSENGDGKAVTVMIAYNGKEYGTIDVTLNETRAAATVTIENVAPVAVTENLDPVEVAVRNAVTTNGGDLTITTSGDMPTLEKPTSSIIVTITAAENANTTGGTATVNVTAELSKVNITWQNEDGTELDTDEVYYGATPSYTGATPTKADSTDGQFSYTFKEWTPAVAAVTTNTTYTATYTANTKSYTISWDTDADGHVDETTTAAWGTDPTKAANVPAAVPGANQSFDGWTADGNVAADGTITGAVTYTANFSSDTVYEVKFVVDGDQLGDTQYVNVDKNGTVIFPAGPDKANAIFAGWTNNDKIVNGVPTQSVTLEAIWNTNDANDNNVDDGNETITINVTADDNSTWSVDGAAKIGETNNYLFDSTGDKQLTITAGVKDQPNTYTKYALTTFTVNGETKTSPAAFTMADGLTYNVVLKTTTTTLTLKAEQTIYVNKNVLSDRITGLKEKIIAAVIGETADPANYKVVVDATFNYDLDDLNELGTTGLATALLGNEAKVIITDKTTGLYGNVTVALADSRSTISITTTDVTISAKTAPTDVAEQVKKAVTIKATDPQTKAVTTVAVSDSYISYSPSYAWPADAETKEFTVTVKVGTDATYIGTSETLKLTCTDTTILYTVTYLDGVNETPLYSEKHAEFTETPTIEDPTRTYYTFDGWDKTIAATVTDNATYTAKWAPVLDNNHNDTADEEETYTVIYTDGVDGEEVFADSKTEGLAYGAATPAAPTVPEREGWNFKGWDVNPIPATVSAPTSGNIITYTAQWSQNWVVTFEGHTYVTPAEVENGKLVAEPTDTWDEDHDFLGWYNGTVKYDFTKPVTSNLTLTAKWQADLNRNDIDDATEKHVTIVYKDGETELAKFENVLVDLTTPTIENPTKTGYKFNGWDPEVAEKVVAPTFSTADGYIISYTAQWLNDTNENGIDDALETITITVNKASDEDKFEVTGAQLIEGNTYIFDSTAENKTVTIKATPVVNDDKSTTYVSGIEGVEGTGSYDNTFAYTFNFNAADEQAITVNFAEAKFVYNTVRELNYHDKMTEIKNDDLYNAVADTPDLGEGVTYTVTYKAREAMTHTVAIDALDLNDTVKWLLKTITRKDAFTFDMPELWLEVDLEGNEELNAKIKNAVSLEQSVKINLTSEKLLGLLDVFNNNGGFPGGVSAAWNELQKILGSVTDAATYYDAHVFGYNDTGAETITEVIKVTYKNNAMYIEGETDVTLKDMRATSYVLGSNISVIYKDYTDKDLADLIGAYVAADAAGSSVIEDAQIVCQEITDPYTMEGSNVSDIAYNLTFKFDGDETYKPSKKTFTVTVTKASAKLDLPNLIVEYGQDYDPVEQSTITLGNKYGEKSDITNSLIEFLIGLDVADLDVNADGVTGLATQVQLIIPEDILGVLSNLVPEDGIDMSLSDLTKFLEPLEDSSIDVLKQALEAIQGITESGDIRININGKYPTNIGAYLYGAVSTNPNYETAFDVGYLLIKPDAERVYLDWNYNDTNGIFTPELLQHVDLGASAYNDDTFAEANTVATNKINNLFFGLDINGELVAELYNQEIVDPETLETTLNNGAYTQLAFIADFGNEMHYAVPIVRAFAIVPNTIDVTIVDQENTNFVRTFDNDEQELDVVLKYTGSALTPDQKYLTVTYTGIQTNVQVVEPTENAPVHAGAYLVTAFYNETDANGKVVAVGADVKTLLIKPAETATVVEDVTITVGSDFDLMDDMVKVATDSGVTSPDMTIISAQIATDGTFSENGASAIKGSVNIDFPKWVKDMLKTYAPEILGETDAAEFVELLNSKLPAILAKLEEAGATSEITNSLTNLVKNVSESLALFPENVTLNILGEDDQLNFSNVGVYAVAAIVTDSDHMPSTDYGFLVVRPKIDEVELVWNYDDENGIWTREKLATMNLLATAYDKGTTNVNAATAKITYQFIGVDKTGELKVIETNNPSDLPNGAYIQVAYIELELDGNMVVSDLIARPIVLTPGTAEVVFVDENGAVNNDRHFTFDNTQKSMKTRVTVNGQVKDTTGKMAVKYTGIQTNGKIYDSATAPTNAGIYSVVAEYTDYTDGGSVAHYGVAAGIMAIEPAESKIEVTGGTVPYDGEAHTATVAVDKYNSDYTLISGGAYISGDVEEVGVDAFHGNLNINFPEWFDDVLTENNIPKTITATDLAQFIKTYREQAIAAIPTEKLVKLGLEETKINEITEKLNGYIDELLIVLEKLPKNVILTIGENSSYTEPGAYLYYGIVTDSDRYPYYTDTKGNRVVGDTGLLIIEKADLVYDLLDTTVTWDGEGHMVDVNNEKNADALQLIIDRETNTMNILLDNDAQYLLNALARILDVEFDGDVQMSTILEQYNGAELAAAIVDLINEAEKLELTEEIAKALAAIKTELETLPTEGTIVVNGELPSEIGEYEVYAVSYSQYYKTNTSEAVLKIVPVKVEVVLDNSTKVYGAEDPELTYTVNYYDHNNVKLENKDAVTVAVERAEGEDVGHYAINATVTLKDEEHYVLIAEPAAADFEITPAEIVSVEAEELTYNKTEQTTTLTVIGVNNEALVEGKDYKIISGNKGTNADTYTVTIEGMGNYTGTYTAEWKINQAEITSVEVTGEYVYNGEEQTAVIVVKAGDLVLAESDYTVANNKQTDADTYAVTVTGNVNYAGTATAEWTIAKKTITESDVKLNGSLTYNGTEQTQEVTVTDGITTEVIGNTGTNAGDYTLTVKGTGNYDGKVNLDWTIAKKDITIAVENKTAVYGDPIPAFTSKVEGLADGEELNITYTCENTGNVDEYPITAEVVADDISKNYNVTSNTPGTLTITAKEITASDVILGEKHTYDGTEKTQTVVVAVKLGGNETATDLVLNTDYNVTGNVQSDVGAEDYTLIVTGTGNYIGTVELKWNIIPKTITDEDVALDGELFYKGTEQTQQVKVTEGVNYTVTGNSATDVKADGNYELTVTGTGNYTGEVKKPWNIIPAEVEVTIDDKEMGASDPAIPELTWTHKFTNGGTVAKEDLDEAIELSVNVEKNKADQFIPGTYPIEGKVKEDKVSTNWKVTFVGTGAAEEGAEKPANGTLTVTIGQYVCMVESTGTYYTTLADGLTAVEEGGKVIILCNLPVKDQTFPVDIPPVEKEVTVDVNDNKLWLTSAKQALKSLAADGWTVTDADDEDADTFLITKAKVVADGEAQIGNTVYPTLAEAIAAANAAETPQNIQILKPIATKPEATITTAMYIVNAQGHTLWNEDGIKASLDELLDPAYQVTDVGGMNMVFSITEKPVTAEPVARNTRTRYEYTTAEAALAEAISGDTVIMIANSDESARDLTINPGITLNLDKYELKVASMYGRKNTKITATIYNSNSAYGSLVTDSLEMPEDGYNWNAAGTRAVMPIWNGDDRYVFTNVGFVTPTKEQPYVVDEEAKTIKFKFAHAMSSSANNAFLTDGNDDNRLSFKIRAHWKGTMDSDVDIDFTYSNEFVEIVASDYTMWYVFTLTDYDKVGINIEDFSLMPIAVSDTGAMTAGAKYPKTTN